MNVTKLPSGTWRARVYIWKENGKSVYQNFLGSTRREAEVQAMQFEIEFEQNPQKALAKFNKVLPEAKEQPISYDDMTVGECIDAYINNLIGVASASTIKRYKADRKKFFRELMVVRLRDL